MKLPFKLPLSPKQHFEISFDDDKLVLTGHRPGPESVRWDELIEVIGHKIDAITVDQIRFDLNSESGGIVITEDDDGFKEAVEEIQRRLPGFDANWREKVVLPPFEPCVTTLWKKKQA